MTLMIPNSFADAAALAMSQLSLLLLLAKATIILLAALGITMAMQRASAGARHLVWLVTLGTLLVMPALTAWGPLRLRILPAAEDSVARTVDRPSIGPAMEPRITPSPDATETSAASPAAPAAPLAESPSMLDGMSALSMVMAIWALVVLAIGCSLVWSALAVRRIVRGARPLDTPDWLGPLWEVADRFGLEEAPRLLRSDDAKMPFACGLVTPTIVLPSDCDGWTLDRRRAVLLHELAHVRRRDLMGHTLGRLVCAVYWFHPLVWTAAKQLRNESERACDDLALSCGTRATDYAEHLLDIVTSVRRDATPSVALAMARRKEFEGRMLAILDPQLRRVAPSRRQSASLIGALALIAVTVGAADPVRREAPRLVSSQARDTTQSWLAPAPLRDTAPMFERDARQVDRRIIASATSSAARASASAASGAAVGAAAGAAAGAALGAGTDAFGKHTRTDLAESTRVLAEVVTNQIVMPTVSVAMRNLLGSQSGQSRKADDRPILLAKVLRTDTSATLRRVAAWGLSEYADAPVAAEALANALRRDASADVREMAAWALADGDDGTASALDALSAAVRGDADVRVRATAAWALGNIGDRGTIDALVAALGDASPEVRKRALWAIGNVEPQQAPRAVIALLADKEPRVRKLAAWTLYRIEDPSAAPALEAALRTEADKDLQLAYIHALASLGEKSVDALRGLLESPDARIKTMAVKALAGGHAAGPWPWPWPEPRPYP
jgi:beta-lactamase regulating signal transducer with metallopeptidase domain/HEAT repeat protein